MTFLFAFIFSLAAEATSDPFYSKNGREHIVTYTAQHKTWMTQLEQVQKMTSTQRQYYKEQQILPLLGFSHLPEFDIPFLGLSRQMYTNLLESNQRLQLLFRSHRSV